jgi:hypothetical protein
MFNPKWIDLCKTPKHTMCPSLTLTLEARERALLLIPVLKVPVVVCVSHVCNGGAISRSSGTEQDDPVCPQELLTSLV